MGNKVLRWSSRASVFLACIETNTLQKLFLKCGGLDTLFAVNAQSYSTTVDQSDKGVESGSRGTERKSISIAESNS